MTDLSKIELSNYKWIVCSIHLNSKFFNIGDYLSAKWLSNYFNINNIIWIPENMNKVNWKVIYWWWWMIRPGFSNREVYKYYLNHDYWYSIIWVWINKDIKSKDYDSNDINAIYSWINWAEFVFVRDLGSYKFIKEVIYNWNLTRKIWILPCPSYLYLREIKTIYNFTEKKKKYNIWFVPSFWHTKWYALYIEDMHNFILNLLKIRKSILIICHDENDFSYVKENFFDLDVFLVKDFRDICESYYSCNKIITSRAHGIIFSASLWLKCSYIYLNDKLKYIYDYH